MMRLSEVLSNVLFVAVISGVLVGTVDATTVTFQAGDGGSYSETADAWIQVTAPDANMGVHADLRIRDVAIGLGRSAMISFPNIIGTNMVGGQIPSGVLVSNATIELTSAAGNSPIYVYLLTRNWDEGNLAWDNVDASGEHGVTWNKAKAYFTGEGTDVSWDTAGAEGLSDRITYNHIDDLAVNTNGNKWVLDITSAVQDWVDGATNYGIIMVGYSSINSTFRSSEYGTISERPKLTVSYGSRPVVDTSGATTTVSFQHNDGGLYSDTDDTWMLEDATDKNTGLSPIIRVRGSSGADRSIMIAYRDIIGSDIALGQIPLGSTISNATLRLTEATTMNASVQAAFLLKDWDAGNLIDDTVDAINEFGATWNNAKNYYTGQGTDIAWGTAGAQGNGDRDNSNIIDTSTAETSVGSGLWEWDVTSAVQAWADGTNNYGLILFRTEDSVNAQLHSANSTIINNRPLLTVIYTPPLPMGTVIIIK